MLFVFFYNLHYIQIFVNYVRGLNKTTSFMCACNFLLARKRPVWSLQSAINLSFNLLLAKTNMYLYSSI